MVRPSKKTLPSRTQKLWAEVFNTEPVRFEGQTKTCYSAVASRVISPLKDWTADHGTSDEVLFTHFWQIVPLISITFRYVAIQLTRKSHIRTAG